MSLLSLPTSSKIIDVDGEIYRHELLECAFSVAVILISWVSLDGHVAFLMLMTKGAAVLLVLAHVLQSLEVVEVALYYMAELRCATSVMAELSTVVHV